VQGVLPALNKQQALLIHPLLAPRCTRTYRTAIASIIASPTCTTMVRLKVAPKRGHALAVPEITARHAGHDVILANGSACLARPYLLLDPLFN
jgi:hypothetical protein